MEKLKKVHIIIITCWIIVISFVITLMHSWHYVDLTPTNIEQTKIEGILPTIKNGHGIAHFITPACSCSEQVFNHLIKRSAYSNELAIIIDDNDLEFAKKLKEKGYLVKTLETKKLSLDEAEMVKGVPLLIIYNEKMQTEYIGGYSDKSITPFTEINIASFLNSIKEKRKIASLPVIGCAVSKKYQKLLDPLGLKYQEKNL